MLSENLNSRLTVTHVPFLAALMLFDDGAITLVLDGFFKSSHCPGESTGVTCFYLEILFEYLHTTS